MRKSFFIDEAACKAVKLSTNPEAAKELEELCHINAKDGVSLIAVERTTGLTVGVVFNKLHVKSAVEDNCFLEFASNCKYSSSRTLVQFMNAIDAEADLFKITKADCLLEMVYMAVLPAYRGRGIGLKFSEITLGIAKALFNGNNNVKTPINEEDLPIGPIPKGVCCILTSKNSQTLGRKFNLSIAKEISYEKYTFEGKTLAEQLGPGYTRPTVAYLTF
uniref:N-acetyltransferase domain-containing protein n=1 Tax=Photinus pyralis TaxID=7054 RepID=A0A1Y1KMJ3_PHOPY